MKRSGALFLTLLIGIGIGSCGGGGSDTATLGEEVDSLNTAAKNFVDKEQAFLNMDTATATEENLMTPLNEYMAAAQAFQTGYETYAADRDGYVEKLGASISSSRLKAYQQGTADPILAVQIGDLVAQGNAKGSECKQLLDSGDFDGAKDCMDNAKKSLAASTFRVGVSALVGGGAAAVTGLAIAAAPVTISVGAATAITIGVGAAVGLVWDWCTSPSSSRIRAQDDGAVCHFASRSTSFIGSETNPTAMTSLPQGTGKVTIHIPGHAPIVREVTVGPTGIHISLNLVAEDATDSEIKDSLEGTDTTDTPETPEGVTCENVSSVFATPSPIDPGPGVGVTVTATVFPSISGCSVSFSVSGTDGYSDSGSPTSDAAGQISFYIPGGAEGVVDTVTVGSGSAQTVITYTF